MCPVKREAGEIPARSRHRNSRAHAYEPLGDREGGSARLIDQPGDLPAAVRGGRNARIPGHEALAVRNMEIGPRRSFLLLFDTDDRKKSRLSALSEGSGWFTGSEWYKHKEERHMKRLTVMIALMLTTLTIASCGGKQTAAEPATEAATSTAGEAAAETANEAEAADEAATDDEVQAPALALPDGYYTAEFTTDGSMFHVNEAKDGKGILTVKDGNMTIHIVMPSKNVVNLFRGSAEDAQKEGEELIQPQLESVTYSDGTTEEVNSFDVPVPYLNQTFDLALVGTKGKWYDHKVSVSNAVPMDAAQAAALAEQASAAATGAEAAEEEPADDAAGSEVSEEDQKAADEVAALIDAIYVQEWTEETDQMCADAKAAWDALTDEQKELVEGESADPDYFGRDTGDASADDPRNANEIGEKELLVVSFGTSFNDSRAEDIGGIESALQEAYPDWAVRRAFTAQIIINHVLARDGEKIDNVEQALERAAANGVKELVIQPTHLMHGAEYDELTQAVDNFRDMFESVEIAEPLLGEVGRPQRTEPRSCLWDMELPTQQRSLTARCRPRWKISVLTMSLSEPWKASPRKLPARQSSGKLKKRVTPTLS